MKKTLILSLMLLFCASLAFGQAGGILLSGGTDSAWDGTCAITAGYNWIWVIHQYTPGATGSQWKIAKSAGNTCSKVAGNDFFTPIGTAFDGVAYAYGGCFPSDIVIANMLANCIGSAACSYLEVVPDPAAISGQIDVTDCSAGTPLYPGGGTGSKLYFNPPVEGCGTCGLPTKDTNWGKIKAMYN